MCFKIYFKMICLKKNFYKKGAYALIDSLLQNGIEHIFGYPGGSILPIYDELYFWEKENLIKHILVRHEQSAAHAADSYSRITGRVGACFATSGPGATNLVTGLANAKMDSIPVLVFTGQVATNFMGTDAFQEVDIFSITLPIVKFSHKISNPNNFYKVITESAYIALNGRPGPVLVDIPKDVGLESLINNSYTTFHHQMHKSYRFDCFEYRFLYKKFLKKIAMSYQPLLYCGGGLLRSGAIKFFIQFMKYYKIPNSVTLMGKSIINENNYLSLGFVGMHGTAYSNFAISQCDLLISLGVRFDDRVTGKLEDFASNAEVMHIDVDSSELSKNRCSHFSLLGDLKQFFLQIFKLIKNKKLNKPIGLKIKTWLKTIAKWKSLYPIIISNYEKNYLLLSPQECLKILAKKFDKILVATDVGQHQMWAAQIFNIKPYTWVSSSGLGTMGFGIPAGIGASAFCKTIPIFCVTGDASIQMNIQELDTIAQYNLCIAIILLNNRWQGMVRQWQQTFYLNRFSNSYMGTSTLNFASIAKSYKIVSFSVDEIVEFKNLLSLINFSRKSCFLNLNINENENCYPMILPGQSNSQMVGLCRKDSAV